MSVAAPIIWKDSKLWLLDQRLLPQQEVLVECRTLEDVYVAIRDMAVRGAPCIGFSAIYGLALWLQAQPAFSLAEFAQAATYLRGARPTAVNLMFEIDRVVAAVKASFKDQSPIQAVFEHVLKDAHAQMDASQRKNTLMAEIALAELTQLYGPRKLTLMTHCNTGFLACGTLGTALGVISHAHAKNRVDMVFADETRPYMQGARLTAYELGKEGIPYQVVVEGAASYLFTHRKVDAIFVGADRIAANGDTANKVGTSTLAIVAKHYGVPFYVVAPLSSFDFSTESGKHIEIELRHEEEILAYQGIRVAPPGARALNPSFDVTSAEHITGIICERGLVKHPTPASMKVLREGL